MSGSRANKPDTPADVALRECLKASEKRNFIMVAGAGAGKTTSLVKALSTIIAEHGQKLKRSRQRVACITYTEVAADEIWADVGNNPLAHVSTIHSFLWMITRSFQNDIKDWVFQRIDERILELAAIAAAFGPRVQQRTRVNNQRDQDRYEVSRAQVEQVRTFTYGTGSNYPKGILGHDDIIRMATDFLRERPLLQTLVAQQFPFVFVDESQDTQEPVVIALKAVAKRAGTQFCLGFFGDPMQRIYLTGVGPINLERDWMSINKEENFRCPQTVLAVANAIRRDGDDLVQIGGRVQEIDGAKVIVKGSARLFVLPADNRRDYNLKAVRELVARQNDDPAWRPGPGDKTKVLVIVHRMAAVRLGFGDLYAAMNDKAPTAFKDGFLDATAWPLRPFYTFVTPITQATELGQEFASMSLLRQYCPLLQREALPTKEVSELLAKIRTAVHHLRDLMVPGSGATIRDVLNHLIEQRLFTLDPRLLAYLEAGANGDNDTVDSAEAEIEEESTREIAAMDAFLSCAADQFRGYSQYVQQLSPFSTHQGIKGTEFDRVLVVLDDDEGTHVQFSYDKYFGVKPPSERDLENRREGKETTVERTRRLFYVCCTRALTDLVVVYYSAQPDQAELCVRAAKIFPDDKIYNMAALGGH
jgi:DNA helicase II / ATP-dependent DNA helicase PcrA